MDGVALTLHSSAVNCVKWYCSSLALPCHPVSRHLTFNFSTKVCYLKLSSITAIKLSRAVNRDKIGYKATFWRLAVFIS